uniref:HAT C-terminal dimerisation domain-containing protein n=1 Tax=Amphimedon queenslandica TaxID=400682 RepID=A0A1X7U5C6_AMPQE
MIFILKFSADNIDLLNSLDAFNPQSPHFLKYSLISSFAALYGINDDGDLNTECTLATRTFSTKELESVTSVYTNLLELEAAFPTLKKLFQIALTLVVSKAHCERSFSALRRIKTYLRTTMTHARLADISLISIESDLCSGSSFLEETVRRFEGSDKNRTIILS